MIFPKRLKDINDPVVFHHEECVYGGEGRLYDSSDISTCQIIGRWVAFGWGSKATLAPAWQGLVTIFADLGSQSRPWEGLSPSPTSRHFDRHWGSQSNGCLIVGAVDVAPVNESCYSVDLLSRLALPRTEDVRPEQCSVLNVKTFAFKV